MLKKTLTAAVAAAVLSACPAQAAETLDYRIGLNMAGTWSETVRADLDENDVDRDGTEEVAARDTGTRFALTALMPRVPLRDGRVVKPHYDVAQTSLTQETSSTTTDFYGTSGTCVPQAAAATGGGTVASVAGGLVLRPSSDAVLDIECSQPFARWSMSVDLLRVAGSHDVPALGQAPVDVAFAIPPKRFGDWRISVPVRASATQRAFERCPREDPGHTVACPFGWAGSVTLERLTPEIGTPQVRGRNVTVDVRCATACAPVVQVGAAKKKFRVAAGAARRLTARATGARRVTVRVGETRRTFTLPRRAPLRRAATSARDRGGCPHGASRPRAAAAHAASDTLAYAKDGDIYVSAPDGSREARITADGGYAWPSQADDGTLVAVRQTAENGRTPRRLHRFRRDGVRIGAPLETVKVDNRNFVGPLAPQVSPDGTKIAYHFFNTGVLSDRERTSVAYTSVDQGTEPGVFANALGGYLTPSWTADGRVLVFYGAQRTSHVGIDTLGGGYTDWFGDPAVETLLTDGELTRQGDTLVAVGDQNDLRFYDAHAQLRCVMTGFNGDVSEPTWSPDGRALAWEEADGIHVATLTDPAACASVARPLVIPGGQDPDWGPAAPPAPVAVDPPPAAPDTGTPAAKLRVELSRWRGSVRRGPAITVRCSTACALSAKLALRAKPARTLATARANRAGTLKFRVSRKVKRADATLTVTATAGGQRMSVTRRVRLTR